MKTYLIDGYNLLLTQIKSSSKFPDLQSRRDHLLSLLKSFAMGNDCQIVIYFEGQAPQVSSQKIHRRVQVIFLPNRKEADDALKKSIRNLPPGDSAVIITSDRDIQLCARDHGVNYLSSTDFFHRIHSSPHSRRKNSALRGSSGDLSTEKVSPHLSPAEIENWMNLFRKRERNEDS